MPENAWSCERIRQYVESCEGNPETEPGAPEEVLLHLSACDGCLDAYLEAGLRRAPEVAMPREFATRVLERLAAPPPAVIEHQSVRFPYFTLAACLLAAVYALPMIHWNSVAAGLDGATRLLGSYSGALANSRIDTDTLLSLLFGMGMVEMAAASVWLWRLSRA